MKANGDLHINQASVTASGRYTCIASNIKGTKSHTITITVTRKTCTHLGTSLLVNPVLLVRLSFSPSIHLTHVLSLTCLYTCLLLFQRLPLDQVLQVRMAHLLPVVPNVNSNSLLDSNEILGDTTLFIATAVAGSLLVLLIVVGTIVYCKCGKHKSYRSRRSSYNSRSKEIRKYRFKTDK